MINLKSSISVNKMAFGLVKNTTIKKRAVIIDDISGINPESGTDINNDGRAELWHGYKAKGALLSAGSHKELPEVELIPRKRGIYNTNKLIKKLMKRNNNDNPYDDVHMVNHSESGRCSFKEIENATGIKIDSKTVHKNKEDIVPKINFKYLKGSKFISNLEKLAKKARVYVSACNLGDEGLNFYSFAEGVKTIGGLNEWGYRHENSAETSLSGKNDWAPYEFIGKLVDKEGKLVSESGKKPFGYDVAPKGQKGDGEADILLSELELTSDNPVINEINFRGTSYSSPYKLGKDHLARKAGKVEWNPFELYQNEKTEPLSADSLGAHAYNATWAIPAW